MRVLRLMLWLCYLGMVGIAASVNVTPVCLSTVSAVFDMNDTQRGLLLGSTFWGYMMVLIIGAPLTDRYGPIRFFYAASVLQICGFFAASQATSAWSLGVACLITGVGGGLLESMLSPLICAQFPDRKTGALNLLHGFYAFGAVGVVFITRTILAEFDSPFHDSGSSPVLPGNAWRWVYGVMALIPVVYGLGFFYCFKICGLHVAYPRAESYWDALQALKRRGFWVFGLAMLTIGGCELGAAQWIPYYLEIEMDWGRELGAMGLVIFSLSMGGGRLIIQPIAGRYSPAVILIWAAGLSALCLTLLGMSFSSMVAVAAIGSMGVFIGWMWPTTLALASEVFPKGGATLLALICVAGNAGGILFPGLVGLIGEHYHLRAAMTVLALAPLTTLVIFMAWRIKHPDVKNQTN